MANNTYTIIYYDSADSAHTTALSDLTTAGGVDIGDGIVDGSAAYYNAGILDNNSTYTSTGITNGVSFYSSGHIDLLGNYHQTGVITAGSGSDSVWQATGIYDGTTYYDTGIVCSEYNGTTITVAFPAGIIQSDGASWDSGIFDANTRYASGIFDGSTYTSSGIFDGTTTYGPGVFGSDGIYHSTGIYDGTSYHDHGVFGGNLYYSAGVVGDFGGFPTATYQGIVDSSGILHDKGILGGNGYYYGYFNSTTIIEFDASANMGNYYSSGVLDDDGTRYQEGIYTGYDGYSYTGIADGTGYTYSSGIFDGTTYYNSGIWDGSISQIRYESGVWDGSNYNQYGILHDGIWDGSFVPTYADYGIFGEFLTFGNYNSYGILDTTQFPTIEYHPVGMIVENDIEYAYYSNGILYTPTENNPNNYTYRNADGVLDGNDYFDLTSTDSPPYIAGYDAAPQSDILGSGLL